MILVIVLLTLLLVTLIGLWMRHTHVQGRQRLDDNRAFWICVMTINPDERTPELIEERCGKEA